MQVNDHDYAGLHGNAEQCNVADPDRNAEVVTERPLQNQPARQSVDRRENENRSFHHRPENHVQQYEDDKEDDGQDQLQASLGPLLELVFSSPLIAVARWQVQTTQNSFGFGNEAAVILGLEVKIDVRGECSIFVPDHGWSA